MEWHLHATPYAAIVLAGGYEEAGDHGRFHVQPGDVVFHDAFCGHLNRFPQNSALVLNLELPTGRNITPGLATLRDPDAVLRLADSSHIDAIDLLLTTTTRKSLPVSDWPDLLASDLLANPALRLSAWASQHNLSPWTISRGFTQIFGVTPEAFRLRSKTRHAWNTIRAGQRPLPDVAATCGFSDQAHMTRSIKSMTGLTPTHWRPAANRCKTRRAPHA